MNHVEGLPISAQAHARIKAGEKRGMFFVMADDHVIAAIPMELGPASGGLVQFKGRGFSKAVGKPVEYQFFVADALAATGRLTNKPEPHTTDLPCNVERVEAGCDIQFVLYFRMGAPS